MATRLQDFREQYPQYRDWSDEDLAESLRQKYYPDLDVATYRRHLGLDPLPESPPEPTIGQRINKVLFDRGKKVDPLTTPDADPEIYQDPDGFEIDTTRPGLINPDGSMSTEETIGVEFDGRQYNIPTIVNGRRVSRQEAEDDARARMAEGWIYPNFDTIEESDQAAQRRSDSIAGARSQAQASGSPVLSDEEMATMQKWLGTVSPRSEFGGLSESQFREIQDWVSPDAGRELYEDLSVDYLVNKDRPREPGNPKLDLVFAGWDELMAGHNTMKALDIAGEAVAVERGEITPRTQREAMARAMTGKGLETPEAYMERITADLQDVLDTRRERRQRSQSVIYSPETRDVVETEAMFSREYWIDIDTWQEVDPTSPDFDVSKSRRVTSRGALSELTDAPITIIAELFSRSGANMAEVLPLAIAGGFAAGPLGFAGGTGIGSGFVEYRARLTELIEGAGYDLNKAEDVLAIVRNEELLREFSGQAALEAGLVAAFDATTAGIATKTVVPKLVTNAVAREITNVVAQTAIQAGGGGAGELSAQVARGEGIHGGQILAEMAAEAMTAPVDVGTATLTGVRQMKTEQMIAEAIADVYEKLGTDVLGDVEGPNEPQPFGEHPPGPTELADNEVEVGGTLYTFKIEREIQTDQGAAYDLTITMPDGQEVSATLRANETIEDLVVEILEFYQDETVAEPRSFTEITKDINKLRDKANRWERHLARQEAGEPNQYDQEAHGKVLEDLERLVAELEDITPPAEPKPEIPEIPDEQARIQNLSAMALMAEIKQTRQQVIDAFADTAATQDDRNVALMGFQNLIRQAELNIEKMPEAMQEQARAALDTIAKLPEPDVGDGAGELEEPSAAVSYYDNRLKRREYRERMARMADELVFDGGQMGTLTREETYPGERADTGQATGTVTDRAPSENPPWYQDNFSGAIADQKMDTVQLARAVSKAIEGKRLGVRQQRVIGTMLDIIQDAREEQVDHARGQLEQAREKRRQARQQAGIPPDENETQAGEEFDEDEYDGDMTAESRIIYELMHQASAVGIEDDVLEGLAVEMQDATDQQFIQRLEELISEHERQARAKEVAPEPPTIEEPGTEEPGAAPGAPETQEVTPYDVHMSPYHGAGNRMTADVVLVGEQDLRFEVRRATSGEFTINLPAGLRGATDYSTIMDTIRFDKKPQVEAFLQDAAANITGTELMREQTKYASAVYMPIFTAEFVERYTARPTPIAETTPRHYTNSDMGFVKEPGAAWAETDGTFATNGHIVDFKKPDYYEKKIPKGASRRINIKRESVERVAADWRKAGKRAKQLVDELLMLVLESPAGTSTRYEPVRLEAADRFVYVNRVYIEHFRKLYPDADFYLLKGDESRFYVVQDDELLAMGMGIRASELQVEAFEQEAAPEAPAPKPKAKPKAKIKRPKLTPIQAHALDQAERLGAAFSVENFMGQPGITAEGKINVNTVNQLLTKGYLEYVDPIAMQDVNFFERILRISEEPTGPATTGARDLLGDDVSKQQALEDEIRRRDRKRNEGQEDIETGDPGDLFSLARQQIDIEEVTGQPRPRGRLGEVLDAALRRFTMEQEGQGILDDMIEGEISPHVVSEVFWQETYWQLNGDMQARFQRMLKGLGFEPGFVGSVEADGTENVLEDWFEVAEFVKEGLAQDAEYLEGTERGYVALMKWANDQRPPEEPAFEIEGAQAAGEMPWSMSRRGEGDLYIQRIGGKNAGTVYRERQGPNDLAITFDQTVLLPDFMFYLLEYLQPRMAAQATGGPIPSINMATVNSVLIEHFRSQQPAVEGARIPDDELTDTGYFKKFGERRVDTERRINYSKLPADELIRLLYTDELTGIANRRAFEEEGADHPYLASIDADSLKFVNDTMSPDAGDAMLIAIAQALDQTAVEAYHISGDEFYLGANNYHELTTALALAKATLATAEIRTDNGVKKGIEITYGIGTSKQEADARMKSQKVKREISGKRLPRDSKLPPPGYSMHIPLEPPVDIQPGTNYQGFIGKHGDLPYDANHNYVLGDGNRVKIPKKPLRAAHVISELQRRFGRKIYQGRVKGKTRLGFYRAGIGEIRIKNYNDLEVTAHETAHWFDDRYPWIRTLYRKYKDEVISISYDDTMIWEGYAEFMRHWMTQDYKAIHAAPAFYDAFMAALEEHKKEGDAMKAVQMLMHAWHLQGARARAAGKQGLGKESLTDRFRDMYEDLPDKILQSTLDSLRQFKQIERAIRGGLAAPQFSGYNSFRLSKGLHTMILAISQRGTIGWNEKGDIEFVGKSLNSIFDQVKGNLDQFVQYMIGRRAEELLGQKRENNYRPDEIKGMLSYGAEPGNENFAAVFDEFLQFNREMLDFYESSGLLSASSRAYIEEMNKNYVPFNRIADTIMGKGKVKRGGGPFIRLKGGTQNINDVMESIIGNMSYLVHMSLVNVGKRNFYEMILQQQGSIRGKKRTAGNTLAGNYAAPIHKDAVPAFIHKEMVVKAALEGMGLSMKWYKMAKQGFVQDDSEIAVVEMIDRMMAGMSEMIMFFQVGQDPKGNVDFYFDDGEKRFFEIIDPLLWESIQHLGPQVHNMAVNILGGFANVLRRGVVMTPQFQINNFIRDTGNAFTLSKGKIIPAFAAIQALMERIYTDEHYWLYMANGGGFASIAEAEGISGDRIMDAPEKLLAKYDRFISAFEYANRIAEFKVLMRKGYTAREAALAGREISTDFAMHGASDAIRVLTISVPFLNARMQGLYRNVRELALMPPGERVKFAGKRAISYATRALMTITLPSLYLYAINKDDPRYKEIPDWIRDLNWIIFYGEGEDDYTMIPKPFESGMLWGTIPERAIEYYYTRDQKELGDAMLWMAMQTFALDITPQAFQPWLDLARNRKFTGAPVIPAHLKDVLPQEQWRFYTSDAMIALGRKLGISPMKAEHLVKGHFGTLGVWALGAADYVVGDLSTGGSRPAWNPWTENIITSRLFQEGPLRRTKSEDDLYELLQETREITTAVSQMTRRNPQYIDEFLDSEAERQAYLSLNAALVDSAKRMGELKRAQDLIAADPRMAPDVKRREINEIQRAQNLVVHEVRQAIDPQLVRELIEDIERKLELETQDQRMGIGGAQ